MGKEITPAGAGTQGANVPAVVDEFADVEPFVNEDGEILLRGFAAMKLREYLNAVPVSDDANDSIVQQLISGDSILDLNAPWDATGAKEFAGKVIRIDSVKAQESQYPNGLRAFLVLSGWSPDTGKNVTLTSSALAVVVQSARCVYEGWLPFWCTVEVAARPSKSGYYPYHLRMQAEPQQVAGK